MTREEAYNRIDAIIAKHEIDDVYVTITNFMDYDALRMAREILEQKPCEDAISRADAIANIRILYPDMPVVDIMGARHKWSEKYQQYRDCEKILADLPSIQPKPKTDEPMQVELEADGYSDGKLVYDYGKCPKCGWQFEYGEKDWEEPYCCHCGQRLKWFESEDEE